MAKTAPRILLLANRFEVRGTTAYTLRLAERLAARGFEPLVVTSDARALEPSTRSRLDVREYRSLWTPLWGRVVRDSLRRDLRERPPALVHVQSRAIVRPATILATEWERPVVVTVHDQQQAQRERGWFRPPIRRVIAVSDAVRSELVARSGVPAEAITVVHSGVDVPSADESAPVLEPGHVPVVGTAGPLEAAKGLPFFLGAAQRVLATGRDVEFLIAGAGPEENNLRRVARELGIADHVTFVPNLSDFSVSISAMDVFCLPSLRQGLGTIMLEAMARGKPVIATGVGGVYSVVHDGETGLVVPPCDSARLAERVLELLDDPVRGRRLGEQGRQYVRERFGVEEMVDRTCDVYREVLAETPTPSERRPATVPTSATPTSPPSP